MNYVARVLAEAMTDPRVAPCGDCFATAELRQVEPKMFMLEIKHDPTCPAYRAGTE